MYLHYISLLHKRGFFSLVYPSQQALSNANYLDHKPHNEDWIKVWRRLCKSILNTTNMKEGLAYWSDREPIIIIGEGNGNPLQCSCLENPRDGGTWWAAIYGVAQSRTRLKRLSSSSSSNNYPKVGYSVVRNQKFYLQKPSIQPSKLQMAFYFSKLLPWS